MIVTIDGPAGSGKSTAARKLAARLGVPYLDTGAMYRAVAHAALARGLDLSDEQQVGRLANELQIDLDCGPTFARVKVDGRDVSEAIRSLAVSTATSRVARQAAVRQVLVAHQQRIGRGLGSFVTEGRDQGAIVFPDAEAKFVLEASLDRRAERRFQEMAADGEPVTLDEVRRDIVARDKTDAKQWAPLLAPGEAVVLDTTDLSIAEVVERLAADVGRSGSARSATSE